MKRINLILGSAIVALSGSLSAATVKIQFEIAPLNVARTAQVVGIRAVDSAKNAIVFSGNAAQVLAQEAGVAINTSKEVLIATGTQVNSLVANASKNVVKGTQKVLIVSSEFASKAYTAAYTSVRRGAKVFSGVAKNYVSPAVSWTASTIVEASNQSISLITDSGSHVINGLRGTSRVLGVSLLSLPKSLLDLIGNILNP